MNCIVNLAAVASGDIGISYCQEVSTVGFCSAISLREDTGWGLKQEICFLAYKFFFILIHIIYETNFQNRRKTT